MAWRSAGAEAVWPIRRRRVPGGVCIPIALAKSLDGRVQKVAAMTIAFSCPSCQAKTKVNDELAGRKTKCAATAKRNSAVNPPWRNVPEQEKQVAPAYPKTDGFSVYALR